MTQEELDALMSGGVEDIGEQVSEEVAEDFEGSSDMEDDLDSLNDDEEVPAGYNEGTAHNWPLPATDENKMVHQLDDVTKESEEKATEIFDIIENISNDLMDKEEDLNRIIEVHKSNIELFNTLNEKFPSVEAFKTQLEKNNLALEDANSTLETLQDSGDMIMNVMDIMQYQDIHRQKIERVINVMRALSGYMNKLFEGRIDDKKRVSSAQHIVGDTHNDLASTDDIEALLDQFNNK